MNPQANDILESMHAVISDVMCTSNLDIQETLTTDDGAGFITSTALTICTYHIALGSTPGQATFGQDMFFKIPYLAEWKIVGELRQMLVDQKMLIVP